MTNDIKTLTEQALHFMRAEKHNEAAAVYKRILLIDRNQVEAWSNLGIALRAMKHQRAALGCYRKVMALTKGNWTPGFHSNFSNLLNDLGHHKEAHGHSLKAIEAVPDDKNIALNHALLLRDMKRFSESMQFFDRLAEHDPDDARLQWNRAFTRLYTDFSKESWEAFEWRWRANLLPIPPIAQKAQRWKGEVLDGKRIVLTREQGFGDTILMVRYLSEVKKRGGHVAVETREPLRRLFETLPADEFVDPDKGYPLNYDYYCPMMSLPGIFGTTRGNIPKPLDFNIPDDALEKFAPLEPLAGGRLKVGVVWSGSVTFKNNHERAVDVSRFVDLAADLPGAQFVSLQVGPRAADLRACHGDALITDLTPMLTDFAMTAALLRRLDILVMTDSSVAHLAGSIGTPVLDLLNYRPYWLYMPEKPTTPWYSSMRMIRQPEPEQWDPVFKQTLFVLQALCEQKANNKGNITHAQVLKGIDRALRPAKRQAAAQAPKTKRQFSRR
jgi:hypothetical protein